MATGADASYTPPGGIHRHQDDNRMSVGSASEVDFLSGATLDFESGAEINMASGSTFNMAGTLNLTGTVTQAGTNTLSGTIAATSDAVIDLSTGGVIKHFVETGSTTTNLRAYGVSTITKTSATGPNIYTMDNPIKGVLKHLVVLQTDSTDTVRVELSGATLAAAPAATNNALVWASSGTGGLPAGGITLVGLSTALWGIIGNFGTVATTS